MRQVWQGRMLQAAVEVGDQALVAAVCCNACRTSATTSIVSLGLGRA